MNEIALILMERDGLTKSEAWNLVKETRELIDIAISSNKYDIIEDILANSLRLEMDYILDILYL